LGARLAKILRVSTLEPGVRSAQRVAFSGIEWIALLAAVGISIWCYSPAEFPDSPSITTA